MGFIGFLIQVSLGFLKVSFSRYARGLLYIAPYRVQSDICRNIFRGFQGHPSLVRVSFGFHYGSSRVWGQRPFRLLPQP